MQLAGESEPLPHKWLVLTGSHTVKDPADAAERASTSTARCTRAAAESVLHTITKATG